LGAIAGHVFEDVNGNGLQDGEPNLAGISITVVDAQGLTYTTTTDAAGNYSLFVFSGVATVTVTAPVNYGITTANSPQNVLVPLAGLQNATAVGLQQQGVLTGVVFNDLDASGSNTSEPGLLGVSVVITDAFGRSVTVTTDAGGAWALSIAAGTVNIDVIEASIPGLWVLTTANEPQAASVAYASTTNSTDIGYNQTATATFTPTATMTPTASETPTVTETPTDVPFGSTATNTPSISPTPSATPSATETAVPFGSTATRTATLTRTASATRTVTPTASETPTASPSPTVTATFTDVPFGSTATNTPSISPTSSDTATATPTPTVSPTAGFGVVTGKVFYDLNGNGVQGAEPSLADIDVFVYSEATDTTLTVQTDSFGFFSALVPSGGIYVNLDLSDPDLPSNPVVTSSPYPLIGTLPQGGSLNLPWIGVNNATPTPTPSSTATLSATRSPVSCRVRVDEIVPLRPGASVSPENCITPVTAPSASRRPRVQGGTIVPAGMPTREKSQLPVRFALTTGVGAATGAGDGLDEPPPQAIVVAT